MSWLHNHFRKSARIAKDQTSLLNQHKKSFPHIMTVDKTPTILTKRDDLCRFAFTSQFVHSSGIQQLLETGKTDVGKAAGGTEYFVEATVLEV